MPTKKTKLVLTMTISEAQWLATLLAKIGLSAEMHAKEAHPKPTWFGIIKLNFLTKYSNQEFLRQKFQADSIRERIESDLPIQ